MVNFFWQPLLLRLLPFKRKVTEAFELNHGFGNFSWFSFFRLLSHSSDVMDAFGDSPVDFPDDPAADFLAREQEELGDLGQELGLGGGEVSNGEADFFGISSEAAIVDSEGAFVDPMAEMRIHSTPSPQMFMAHPKPKEEPETIRKWREEYARLLLEKDERETKQMEELKDQAKKELSDWYLLST